jgi:hypothetical protein
MSDVRDRCAAAALLGVPVDADADEVRRAYRLWARMTHPDHGGDPAAFARLTAARRLLLDEGLHAEADPPHRATAAPSPTPAEQPAPRPPLREVVGRPRHAVALAAAALVVLALTALPLAGLSVPAAALVCGVLAAAWSALAARSALHPGADAGHRIAAHVLAWLPLAATVLVASTLLGTGFIGVLPLLALPFAAVVGAINAGAGLWRPLTGPART